MTDQSKTTDREPEYTREEMREACRNNYNAGILRAMDIVLSCADETPPVEVFRAIQKELS